MIPLRCGEASELMNLRAGCWPDVCIPKSDLLRCKTFDDEGATTCFAGKTWRQVVISEALRHPIAIHFVSNYGVMAYLPAIVVSAAAGLLFMDQQDLESQWGCKVKSIQGQSLLLLDIAETEMKRAAQQDESGLNQQQQEWLASVIDAIRHAAQDD